MDKEIMDFGKCKRPGRFVFAKKIQMRAYRLDKNHGTGDKKWADGRMF